VAGHPALLLTRSLTHQPPPHSPCRSRACWSFWASALAWLCSWWLSHGRARPTGKQTGITAPTAHTLLPAATALPWLGPGLILLMPLPPPTTAEQGVAAPALSHAAGWPAALAGRWLTQKQGCPRQRQRFQRRRPLRDQRGAGWRKQGVSLERAERQSAPSSLKLRL